MDFRAICVALLLTSLPIAGCGTVGNLVVLHPEEGGKSPFGGVRQDVSSIETAAHGESAHPPVATPLVLAFCAADLPFSFIGDIVTWPYTAAYSFINQPIPTPPIIQAPAEFPPRTPPVETLPEPKVRP